LERPGPNGKYSAFGSLYTENGKRKFPGNQETSVNEIRKYLRIENNLC